MMPRKDTKMTADDWQRVSNFAKAIGKDSKDKDIKATMKRFVSWVEKELERREKSGKAGGRPKKEVGASPELTKALNHLLPNKSAPNDQYVDYDEEYLNGKM
jgi:hypothetical protein